MGRRRVKGKAKQSKALARIREEAITGAVSPGGVNEAETETPDLEREFEALDLETEAKTRRDEEAETRRAKEAEALQKILKTPEEIYETPRSNGSTVYHSTLIESLLANVRLSSGLDDEIQFSKFQWTDTDESSDEEEYSVERDREYFETLKQRTRGKSGSRFEDFPFLIVHEKIAEGGQAEIYEALLHNQNKAKRPLKCVVKVFKRGYSLKDLEPQWPLGMVYKEDHLRSGPLEYILGATLSRDERLKDRFAFVMRRQWGDLRKLIVLRKLENGNQGPPFDHEEVLNLMRNIARHMHILHVDHDILHRDLKASNVLMFSKCVGSFSMVCTVADFECSVGVLGTGFWRAPEILRQLKNRVVSSQLELTRKSDVYSYGMTCYEIVTGRQPFEGHDGRDFDLVIEGARPELPSDLCPLVRNIITSCWDDDPSKRPTFKEIYDKLVSAG